MVACDLLHTVAITLHPIVATLLVDNHCWSMVNTIGNSSPASRDTYIQREAVHKTKAIPALVPL